MPRQKLSMTSAKATIPGRVALPHNLVMADALRRKCDRSRRERMVIVELGHTDTDYTTCLHVPSNRLHGRRRRRLQQRPPLYLPSRMSRTRQSIAPRCSIRSRRLNRALLSLAAKPAKTKTTEDHRRDTKMRPQDDRLREIDKHRTRAVRQDAGPLCNRVNPGPFIVGVQCRIQVVSLQRTADRVKRQSIREPAMRRITITRYSRFSKTTPPRSAASRQQHHHGTGWSHQAGITWWKQHPKYG